MLILSGDIRNQSRKLSKIVPKFGRFVWPSQNLGGGASKSCTHIITPTSRHVVWKKFREDTTTDPEVIGAHTLNFRPNFKFSPLKILWGPRPRRGGVRYVAWVVHV